MRHGPRRSGFLHALAPAVLVLGAGAAVAACGSAKPSGAASSGAGSGSCAGVPGTHHARLVVEPSRGKVVERCVGFGGASIKGLQLLTESRIETGTQKYSFGVAICQVDDVPAHYSQCLASGQDYWALFVSNGRRWTSPSSGVSDIKVPAGGSLGLRYDPPTGRPAPPPPPSPA